MLCSHTHCLSFSTALEQQLARVTAERDALVDLCDKTLAKTTAGNDSNDKSMAAAAAAEGPAWLRRLAIKAPSPEKFSGALLAASWRSYM